MRNDEASATRRLTVGYSTLAHRVGAIQPAPWWDEADVVVVVQTGGASTEATASLSVELQRLEQAGARTATLDSIGVARSRNEVLRRARTRWVLFSDDDVTIDMGGVRLVVDRMEAQGLALGLGRAVGADGQLRKRFAEHEEPLTLFNSAKAATYEMVVDVERTRKHDVWFDESYGAGAENYLGDEYIFIVDVLRAGLTGRAIPQVIATHPVESSGSRWGTREDTDARAAVLDRVFGRWALLSKAGFAARHRTRLGGVRGAWRLLRSTPRSRSRRRSQDR
ncbi:glycosyltransferase [Demequina muriae]|uniref:Glycosyltransferase n=1 Tax=Demequina muriae TaxID=3051664 RepID=A0ABT8GHB7_9MICO|nr:glycosyltransferase [Demequina sp. EGI L300058]MDN4480821.1 glycosyltransferase [Demequina sp. EGI L300058]